MEPIPSAADLAARFNLRRAGGAWRGDCPACGYAGTFALAQRDGRTLWRCASCDDRAGLTAIILENANWQAPPAKAANPLIGAAPEARTARALALWNEAQPIPGTLAEAYLAARGLPGLVSDALRFHPAAGHPGGGRLPAMLALVRHGVAAKATAAHRTYLASDGQAKAAAEPAKASLGPIAGGAVMLGEPEPDRPLIVAEGIETAASAGVLLGGPAWAAVSCGNLARLDLPAGVRRVTIAADPGGPGEAAARAAFLRWRSEGREVRVALPDDGRSDFNDLLRARRAEVVQHVR